MITPKLNSNSQSAHGSTRTPCEVTPSLTHYEGDDGHRAWILLFIILLALGGAAYALAQDPPPQSPPAGNESSVLASTPPTAAPRFVHYDINSLASLGGAVSRGNSVNDRSWVGGYSNLLGDQARHAALWRFGSLTDLGTLGGPNSTVAWPVKNERGTIVGISQTSRPDPLNETFSSFYFYPGPNNRGYINLGFIWENGKMRGLPTLGGNHSFATGSNNQGITVGWAENDCHDPTCVPPQVLQFRPVWWGKEDRIHEYPLVPGDTSGAVTAINDCGQAVGISGICDIAIGRKTARHAVLWDKNGKIIRLGSLGAPYWNTPTAINQRGDVVGFLGAPGDLDGNFLQGFIWTKEEGLKPLGFLEGDVESEAYGINEQRQVVGLSCDVNGACRAFVYQDGVMRDLNTLKANGYAVRLEQAKDINNRGEITGRTLTPATGVRGTFLAIPVNGHE